MQDLHKQIRKDHQILKFSFYGFLKNLRFFEPYLYYYLYKDLQINAFEIGILFSVKEIISYVFEIPSGIFADHYGRKTELYICFIFYIISFLIFYAARNYFLLIIAIIFYGLGEAFRSGTHKSMIYSYLEQKNWFSEKVFVYGRTRSFSLNGSAISSLISIFLLVVVDLPSFQWIFLITIIPYILNFLLILSYPKKLNEKIEKEISIKKFISISVQQLKNIVKKPKLLNTLLSSSLYDGIFAIIKDYIQLLLTVLMPTLGILYFSELNTDSNLIILLGGIYFIYNLFSSIASRNIYRLLKVANSRKLMNIFFDCLGILMIILFFIIKNKMIFTIIGIYFIIYVMKNARRTFFVDVAGDIMKKNERATVLSIDSQLKSFFAIILAPIFGFIADNISFEHAFLYTGSFILLINLLLSPKKHSL